MGVFLGFTCPLASTTQACCLDQYVDMTAGKLLWLVDQLCQEHVFWHM